MLRAASPALRAARALARRALLRAVAGCPAVAFAVFRYAWGCLTRSNSQLSKESKKRYASVLQAASTTKKRAGGAFFEAPEQQRQAWFEPDCAQSPTPVTNALAQPALANHKGF